MVYDVMVCVALVVASVPSGGSGLRSLPVPHRSVQRVSHLLPRLATAYDR